MTKNELYNIVVGLLECRDYSKNELTRYLLRSTADDEIVSSIRAKIPEHNYLYDLNIAENELNKGIRTLHGPTRIKQEMKQGNVDWLDIAKQYQQKKCVQNLPDEPKDKNKQFSQLQFKGLLFGIIMEL